MSAVEKAKTFLNEKKSLVIGLVVTALVAGGGFWAWKKYTHANSPEAYIAKVNTALLTADLAALATLVDFRTLSEDFAQHILSQPMASPSSAPRNTQVPLLSEDIQKFFLQKMHTRDEDAEKEDSTNPLDPLLPVPPNFITQIAGNLSLHTQTRTDAVAIVKMEYPRIEKEYMLQFLLQKKPDWRIVRFLNAKELVHAYVQEDTFLEQGRKKARQIQRDKDKKRIEAQLTIDECTAFLHKPRGQKEPILVVRIRGYNNGPYIIRNMTFDITVEARTSHGQLEFKQKVNRGTRLNVGTTLEDNFNHELQTEGKDAEFLLEAPKVSCTAHVHFMTLDNGEVLYLPDDENYMGKPLPKK